MRLFISGFLCFICALAYAGNFDVVTLKISTVSTNATISQAISGKVTGYAERLDIVCSISTSTPWVKVFASNELSGKLTTIYPNTITATNVSAAAQGTNSSVQRVALYGEYIYLEATNATVGFSDQTLKAFLTYEAK